jgi:aminoglycoside phosphotransferase (APT) family kinase protein
VLNAGTGPGGAEPSWPHDHPTAAALVLRHLPGGGESTLSPVGEGDFCLAFRRRTRVVRVARHARAAAALQREACVLSGIAASLPLPVPRPAFFQPAAGCAFSVHREITGAVLTRERWERMPPAARENAASDLARFLGALHALPVEAGLACDVPVLDRIEYAGRLGAEAASRLYPSLGDEAGRRLDAALAHWSRPSANAAPSAALLHGDLSPEHVLCEPSSGRLTGVIDFGDLAVGDPARDFIYIHEDYGPEMLASVFRHYPGEDAETLLPRVRMWSVLEAVAWTLARYADQQLDEAEEGLEQVARELDALEG